MKTRRSLFSRAKRTLHKHLKHILIGYLCFIPQAKALSHNTEVKCLALAMHKEALAEGEHGMLLVGNVVLNRKYKRKKSVCQVVAEPNQFSWHNAKSSLHKPSAIALKVAQELYNKDIAKTRRDISEGATFFHNTSVTPKWARKMVFVKRHKKHLFYREK